MMMLHRRLNALALGLVAILAVNAAVVARGDAVYRLQQRGRPALEAHITHSNSTCTQDNLRVRREWGDIPDTDKREYIAAVQCLLKTPSRLDKKRYPGAHSRYDDFVSVHMNQTMTIHGTGNFLAWHRYYTWLWEKALQDECGYEGTQPYWDYGRWADDPESSPLFDGSDTSVSGNGKFIPGRDAVLEEVPAGNGGGCVTSGPFVNMTVYFGPVAGTGNPPPPPNPQSDGYGSNPRCLARDMSNSLTSRFGRTSDIAELITSHDAIRPFQDAMENHTPSGGLGIHRVGHFTIAGDPGGDFYTSPNDPAFWFHHAMIDRIWTTWQSLDYPSRKMAMEGGTRLTGSVRAQELGDLVDMGLLTAEQPKEIRELMSSVDGPFCYVYE